MKEQLESLLTMDRIYTLWIAMFFGFFVNLFRFQGVELTNKILFVLVPIAVFYLKYNDMKKIMRAIIPLFVFLAICLIGSACAHYRIISFVFTFNYFVQILFFMGCIYLFTNTENYYRIFKFLVIAATVISVLGILQYIFYPHLESFFLLFKKSAHRNHVASTFFTNPNLMSTFLLGTIMMTALFVKEHYLYKVAMVLQICGQILTGSRGGTLVLLALAVVYTFIEYKRYRLAFIAIYLVLGASLLGVIFYSNFDFIRELRQSFTYLANGDMTAFSSKRNVIYHMAFELFQQGSNWLVGAGNGNFEKEFKQLIYENAYTMIQYKSTFASFAAQGKFGTHSLYVNILVENGIFAFFTLLYFGVKTFHFRKYITDDKLRKLFAYSFITLLCTQIVEMHFTHNLVFIYNFWILASIPYVYYLKAKENKI